MNRDGIISNFWRDHEVLVAQKGGWEIYRNRQKHYEIMRGHRSNDQTEEQAAKSEFYEEGGWRTTRDFSVPGDYLIVRLFGNTGMVVRGLRIINDIQSLEDRPRHREASVMIVVIRDPGRDTFGEPGDRSYKRSVWITMVR